MGQNETTRGEQKIIEKLPLPSGFTPETEGGERAALRYKKLQHQKMIKT